MGKINVLDKHIANMIAAGEVVENPASVVKELVENAIDAGSTAVTVEIQSGGIAYIRITDDGVGMSAEDAKTAFLRHATSKISKADDLEKIGTLGFRGEALAAISAVSKIDLITKARDAEMGVALRVEAGSVIRESESGCPDGTTIIVRELFYNTPARMRFLKKDATEAASVENIVKYISLSHPEVSIKFIKDGKDILHTPGDGEVKSCMYALFGRDFANNMYSVEEEQRGIRVAGFTCAPQASRGNRGLQFFFVNGRCVKSRMLSIALDNAYKERIMKGRFPTCVLMLDIPLGQVDVNVHPAKTEVKFARERDVFDIVYFGVKSALERSEKTTVAPPQTIPVTPQKVDTVTENQTRLESFTIPQKPKTPAFEFKKPEPKPVEKAESEESDIARLFIKRENPMKVTMRSDFRETYRAEPKKEEIPQTTPAAVEEEKLPPQTLPKLEEQVEAVPEAPAEKETEEINLRYIGETMNTYIIVEYGESVIFIDKHAAHERIIFEKLQETVGEPQSQLLLTPEIISFDKVAAAAILDNREELSKLGFEVDEFGDGCVIVSAVPDGIEASDCVSVLEDIAESLKSGARAKKPDVLSEIMYSVSCKAAMKAGHKNSPEELIAIAKRVLLSDDIRYCPHGRPVMIEFTKTELEKKFKRIV